MRVNTARSIRTANMVYDCFGSWKAAKDSADFRGGKFVVKSDAAPKVHEGRSAGTHPKNR